MGDKNIEMANRIAVKVDELGGVTYYVGGYVRDILMGNESKDVDIEVHGISPRALEGILDELGNKIKLGKSFGVLGLEGYDIDIAQPRTEKATGRGHRDFEIFVDPFIGTEKASLRRDFTINAMMQNVLTGEIIDHFGGRRDLENKILRHVNFDTFSQDPLRALRLAQFSARFGFSVADETIELCRKTDLSALAKERVMGELEKALMRSESPSVFFEVLDRIGGLDNYFAELKGLQGVLQDKRHHPEGDVYRHTMLVIDTAAKYRKEAKYPLWFMLSAIVHDFGKKITTTIEKDGKIRSIGHETQGLPMVSSFLTRISGENAMIRYVLNMTQLHMLPNILARSHSKAKAALKLFDRAVCPDDLILLARADRRGKTFYDDDSDVEKYLKDNLALYKERMSLPCVTGKDLISLGFKPSKEFSQALELAHKLALAGVSKESALAQTASFLKNNN